MLCTKIPTLTSYMISISKEMNGWISMKQRKKLYTYNGGELSFIFFEYERSDES